MIKAMYPEERRRAILRILQEQGRVMVAELSKKFGVSEVTVRSDLQALARQGKIVRTHGGAVVASLNMEDIKLERRKLQHIEEKNAIGAAAAAMIEEGDAVFLDSSSTALAIARNLKDKRFVTVLTSSLAVAQELLDAPRGTVVLPGGVLQRETASLVDVDGLKYFDKFNIRRGFFGAHGLAIPEGLTDISADVAAVKRELVRKCREVIAVLDASKWGRVGLATFARVEDIDLVLTDKNAPLEQVQRIRQAGVEVRLA